MYFYIAQEINDMYLFLIVGVLVMIDIMFLVPTSAIDNSRLQRNEEEINADDNVSHYNT